jgi:hypothetical protein
VSDCMSNPKKGQARWVNQTRVAGFYAAGLLAASVLMACSSEGSGQANPSAPVEKISSPDAATGEGIKPTLSYADGAGNSYEIEGSSRNLVFTPVKASESSSGTYNGGVGWTKILSEPQYDALRARFSEAIAAVDQQSTQRSKGMGIVAIGSSQQAILTLSSTIRKNLEADLLALNESP